MRAMRYVPVLVVLGAIAPMACSGGCIPQAHLTHTGADTIAVQIVMQSSVRILADCDGDGDLDGFASGVAVSPRHILTARHVAEGCGRISRAPDMAQFWAYTWDARRIPIVVDMLARDPEVDAARFVVDGGSDPFAVWALPALYLPATGQRVYQYTGDGTFDPPFHWKEGVISGARGQQLDISIHGVPGNSGSAVFDVNGNILGILWGGRWHSGLEFAIGAYRPQAWIELIPPISPDMP